MKKYYQHDNATNRCVVTGMGIVSSVGTTISEFTESLRSGKCGINYITESDNPCTPNLGALIRDFSFEEYLKKYSLTKIENIAKRALKCSRRSNLPIQASIIATLEAWQRSEIVSSNITPDRIGIIVTGNNLTQNIQFNMYPKFKESPEYISPTYALQYLDTDHVGTLSEIFNIHGEGFTIGGASASGNVGIIKGYQSIKSRSLDICIIVGAMADLSPIELQGFYNIGAMGGKKFRYYPKKACRPFDNDHEGFIFGQASACLILESIESAKNRKAPMLAEILGGTIILDGNHLSNPSIDSESRVMELSLNYSKISPDSIDYINTHGSSSPIGDETELHAIKNIFKENLSNIWINSTKCITGHCLYSAGVVETISGIIQMTEGFIHPNINLDNAIDKQFRFSGKKSINENINTFMSNSFGFGGINTSIILKRTGDDNYGCRD